MIIFLTLLIALIGLIMFLGCTNSKFSRVGDIMFFCGLLAYLLGIGVGHIVKLIP